MPSLITRGYGASAGHFLGESVTAYTDEVIVDMNRTIGALTGDAANPSGYPIVPVDVGVPIEVVGVTSTGDKLTVQTTIATVGAAYIVHLPVSGIFSNLGAPYAGPYRFLYTPTAGAPVAIQITRALDARTIEVVFSRRVNEEDASNPANYSIAPTLAVVKAVKRSDFHYRLTTSQQLIGQAYTVTISNIRGA